MQEKDILRFIKGESNSAEKKAILEWIRKDREHQKRYNSLKADYVASTVDSLSVSDIERQYEGLIAKTARKRKRYLVVATVVILLPIAIWQLTVSITNSPDFSNQSIVNVSTGYGSHKRITLPDGSTIVLNAESSLAYPEKFFDSIRQVTLVGEAFFDIKKDTSKPFIVDTEAIKIRVLGTSFNVKSYPEDEKIETTLVTGKVEIVQRETEKQLILEPSQRAVFNKEINNILVDKVNSENVIAWREGNLVFDQTPLKQVVSDLHRKYNVEFVIGSDTLLQYRYTGEFNNLTLEEVLELLKISSPLDYKLKNNKVMLDTE